MTSANTVVFDPKVLETKVRVMHCDVVQNPRGEFYFEMGLALQKMRLNAAEDARGCLCRKRELRRGRLNNFGHFAA